MKIYKFIKNPFLWLGVILLLALFLRLYKIDRAVADWHAWRQADTAAVSRIYYQEGLNLLYPKYYDMSAVSETTTDQNINRYRYVEFPIYNTIIYMLYTINGGVEIYLARLVSVLFSLGSLVFIFFIVRRYWDNLTAVLASFIFAVLPFNIFYSRVVLPEPSLIFFSLGMFYFTDRWIWENKKWLFLVSAFFAASALLTKPFAVFYLFPLLYTYYLKEGRLFPVPARYLLWMLSAFLPFIGWRIWISRHPEGIPASTWLLNGNGIRLRPAFWKWIVGERLGREILSVAGMVLLFFGLLAKPDKKKSLVLYLFALSSFFYIVVVATGNVQHDYYQTLIVPALSIFVAKGIVTLIDKDRLLLNRIITIPVALMLFLLMQYFTWQEVKGLYQINNDSIVIAGEEADRLLPKNAVVIAPYNGDTSFLYYVNRPGWPTMILPEDEMVEKYGVTHYVSVNYDDDTNRILKKYSVIKSDPKYVIVDLKKPIEVNPETVIR